MATTSLNFTKETLNKIPTPAKGRALYKDTKEPYLFVFATPKNKVYYYYRKFRGKAVQVKIADTSSMTPKQARDKATEYNMMIAKGIDPREEKQQIKKELTLKELFELYVKDNKKKKRSIQNDIWMFNDKFKTLGKYKLNNITKPKVKQLHNTLAETPYQANRCLALLSILFNYAINELEIKTDNPCKNIKKYKEESRDRILNKDELHRYRDTCSAWRRIPGKEMHADLFMLLLYTGQRKTNVQKMKFEDIDFFNNSWTIPGEEFKNKESHTIKLYPEAMSIIKRRYDQLNSKTAYIFPSPLNIKKPVVEIKRQWKNFLNDAKITNLTRHDMRRTSGSILLMMTGNLKLVQKFLGHKDISTTAKVYAKLWEEKEAEAINGAFDTALNQPTEKHQIIQAN